MKLSGIRPITESEFYNSIRMNELDRANVLVPAEEQNDVKAEREIAEKSVVNTQQTFDTVSYAQQYQTRFSYDRKETDSDIEKLDVEKAISDMRKKQVLMQYQCFVGESMEQGRVHAKKLPESASFRNTENFDI